MPIIPAKRVTKPEPNLTKALELLLGKPKPVCVACGDTGKASNGQTCVPCFANRRIK